MPTKAKDELENYTADYRKAQSQEQNYKPTKTVVAGVPAIKRATYTNIKLSEAPQKTHKTKCHSVSLNKVLPSKTTFYRLIFACIVLLLAIVGCIIFVTITSTVDDTIETKSEPKGNFSTFLASVVMHDPEPFTGCKTADKQMLASSALWRAITKNGTDNYNTFDERGCALVPFGDVFKAAQELFGENCHLNQNDTMYGPFYTFSAGDEFFHVSAISNQNSFLPYVETSWEENDDLVLKVGYLLRSDKYFSTGNDKTDKPTPIKYMKYIMKKRDNKYYIYAVENIE